MSPETNVVLLCCILPLAPVLLALGAWYLLRTLANRRPRLTVTRVPDPQGQRRRTIFELEMEERPHWGRRHKKGEEENIQ